MPSLTLPSPAKLNLFLHITGRLDNGYHTLQTVFQILDFGDELTFTPTVQSDVTCEGLKGVSDADNLILKAARAIRPFATKPSGMAISVEKRIPMGGGLGGGSSNAATTLHALNRLWACGLDEEALFQLALPLGVDVTLFVRGKSAFGEGIGSDLTPIKLPQKWFVVIAPDAHVDTATMYRDCELTRNTKTITIRDYQNGAETHNDFTPVVCAHYPVVRKAMEALKTLGEVKLTGSGGCLFLSCDSEQQAQDFIGQIKPRMVAFVAQGLDESPLRALI